MTTKQARRRIVTGCLVASMLPFSAQLAKTAITPALTFGGVLGITSGESVTRTGSGAFGTHPVLPAAPWFRETFILFRPDSMFPAKSSGGVVLEEIPAMTRFATSVDQVPGAVENLRRTDQR